jgi:hypothetical protein
MVGHNSSNKNNINGPKVEFSCHFSVLKELQCAIAFRAYEQVQTSGQSMKLSDLRQQAFEKYHGKGDDHVGLVETFIGGNEMFQGIYVEHDDPVTGRSHMVLNDILHCQSGKDIVVDPDPRFKGINKMTRKCTKLTDLKPLSGLQIWEMGKKVAQHGRKMLAIILQSKYKDGNVPSGTEWEDYLKFCRHKMMKKYYSKDNATQVMNNHLKNCRGISSRYSSIANPCVLPLITSRSFGNPSFFLLYHSLNEVSSTG